MVNLSNINGLYSPKDNLPPEIQCKIDAELLNRFIAGKSVFFDEIAVNFPDIYEYLMQSCSELQLVDADGDGSLVYWCIGSENKYIFSSIPKTLRKTKVRISEKEHYLCIPDILKPFYYCFNGVDITDEPNLHLTESGFLFGMTNWKKFGAINSKSKVNDINLHFVDIDNRDLRIIAKNTYNDILVVDLKTPNSKLVHVNFDKTELYEVQDIQGYMTQLFMSSLTQIND